MKKDGGLHTVAMETFKIHAPSLFHTTLPPLLPRSSFPFWAQKKRASEGVRMGREGRGVCSFSCVWCTHAQTRETPKSNPRGNEKGGEGKNEGRKGEHFTQNGKGGVIPWISCVVR